MTIAIICYLTGVLMDRVDRPDCLALPALLVLQVRPVLLVRLVPTHLFLLSVSYSTPTLAVSACQICN